MCSRSDEQLIQDLAGGDEDALRILVDRHTPSIYRFSVRYTGDESLAEDIAQEAFLRLYRSAGSFRRGNSFKTWLFAIVRNTSIDLARRYSYRKIHSLDQADDLISDGIESRYLVDKSPGPEESRVSRETEENVRKALSSLPERQRTAVILKYFEGMRCKEIAEIMELSVSSVESLLVRAKRNLLKRLEI